MTFPGVDEAQREVKVFIRHNSEVRGDGEEENRRVRYNNKEGGWDYSEA